uniref:NADH-ubiquinone oxidoreductase chain 6 n=1 Tax=Trogoderma granarium TaxID=591392 RepID=A0A7D5PVJ7_9COLE|nr:NADH dehydrogenase subunit 6 [Trogoderma granarium]
MTLCILMNMSMFLSSTFMMLTHPLSMGTILLMETLIITLTSGLMNNSFWYSYIMFLIMIGGMMVLFIYMTSVASNEKFKFSIKISLMWLLMPLTTLATICLNINSSFPTWNQESLPMDFITQTNKSMSKFINYPTNMLMYMIIIYLLMTMIAVVKMTNSKYGALRQKT